PSAPPAHPDLAVIKAETGFSRFLQLDVVRFRHRLFSGEWSGERVYDVLRRGDAVAILLYDPDRDSVVLVEQFRLPPLYAGFSPWQIEPVAGLVDEGESYEDVARRETGHTLICLYWLLRHRDQLRRQWLGGQSRLASP